MPGAVFESVGVAGACGDLRADTEVAAARLLAAAGRQLVDVVAQLIGGHPGSGVDHRQLAHPTSRGVEALPVQIPHDPTASAITESRDRVQAVDRQLAQTLNVGALAAEALEQERGVRDGELVPSVWISVVAVTRGVAVERAALASRLVGTGQDGEGPARRRSRQFSEKASARALAQRAVQIDDRGWRRPVPFLQSSQCFAAASSGVRSRPVR